MAEKSPEGLRDVLLKQLVEQRKHVEHMEAWFGGAHPLPEASVTNADLYKRFRVLAQANYLSQVVGAPCSRMAVTGIRIGDDQEADAEAWKMWQRSNMDSYQSMLFEIVLAAGIGYISVWPSEVDEGEVDWSPEHPSEVTHRYKPGNLRVVEAALKCFADDDGWDCTLWTEEAVYHWTGTGDWNGWQWTPQGEDVNPYGEVPIIPLRNKPTLRGGWSSEMSNGIPIQARINQTLLNLLVAEEAVAFPQRWGTGLEIKRDAQGNAIRPFKSGPDGLWVAEGEDVRFGQFSESDFKGYLGAIDTDVEMLASVTATPMFAMSAKLSVPPSAEALTAMESSLVKKVQARELIYGEAIEDAFRLAFKMKGDSRAEGQDAEVIWEDPSIQSLAVVGDYVTKAASVGVPQAALWEKLGATPKEIQRWQAMAMSEAFQQLVLQVGAQQQAERDAADGTTPPGATGGPAQPKSGDLKMRGGVQPPLPGT